MNSTEIQFCGASCGHHGPYTFYRAFSYRRPSTSSSTNPDVPWRSLSLGQFFFVRVNPTSTPSVGELQLVWETSNGAPGQKLASVKLYFLPEDTPTGRQPGHGEDEVLVVKDKIVLELSDLVKWVDEGGDMGSYAGWKKSPYLLSDHLKEDAERDRFHFSSLSPLSVIILSYPQYCRYRAVRRRLALPDGSLDTAAMANTVIQAIGGIATVSSGNGAIAVRVMFCRATFSHPVVDDHEFRRDLLTPKLKGRRRRKKPNGYETAEPAVRSCAVDMPASRVNAPVTEKRSALVCDGHVEREMFRDKEPFEKQLYKFMKDKKTPIKRLPSLGFKEVDLFNFFNIAQKLGGYEKITEDRMWKHIYDQLGGHPGNTSAATCTRRIYEKLLLAYERHIHGQDDKPLPPPYMRPSKPVRRRQKMISSYSTTESSSPVTTPMEPMLQDDDDGDVSPSDGIVKSSTAKDTSATKPSVKTVGKITLTRNESGSICIKTVKEKKVRKRHSSLHSDTKKQKLDQSAERSQSAECSMVANDSSNSEHDMQCKIVKVILENCHGAAAIKSSEAAAPVTSPAAFDSEGHDSLAASVQEITDVKPVALSVDITSAPVSHTDLSIVPQITAGVNTVVDSPSCPNSSLPVNKLPTAEVVEAKKESTDGDDVKRTCLDNNQASKPPEVGPVQTVGEKVIHIGTVKPQIITTSTPYNVISEPTNSPTVIVPPSRLPPASALITPFLSQLVPRLNLGHGVKNTETIGAISPLAALMRPGLDGPRWSVPLNGGAWVTLPTSYSSAIRAPVSVGILPTYRPLLTATPLLTPAMPGVQQEAPKPVAASSAASVSTGGGSCQTTSEVAVGINSPIKQFLDRTRQHSVAVSASTCMPFTDIEEAPTDLSMKTLRRLEQQMQTINGTTGPVVTKACSVPDDDAPLDLCTKRQTSTKTIEIPFSARLPVAGANSFSIMRTQQSVTPILTVPLCFPAAQGDQIAFNSNHAKPLVIPSPRLLDLNNTKVVQPPLLKLDAPRATFTLPTTPLPLQMSYPPSSLAILHPAFQLSAATASAPSSTMSSLPLSPATPVVATLSPFLCSSFLMTRFAAARPVAASVNDVRTLPEQK